MSSLESLLPPYLGRQRWFAGDEPDKVVVVDEERLSDRLRWVIAEADGARYQLVVGESPEWDRPDFLNGHDDQVIGVDEGRLLYDALLDPALALLVLGRVAAGETAEWCRPMGVEQTNTSIVFDDRIVLKLFRRLHDGANPDIEVTQKLAQAGFEGVAPPTAVWSEDGVDLAIVQPFLGGATDGWALALTSLRDFYASDCDDPAECGGDFAGEANRLGQVTARMHLALAAAFGREPGDAAAWRDAMHRQLDRIGRDAPWRDGIAALFDALPDGGAAIRVHGDYHLGQVLRTDNGWYVLDFEGEPARPLDERRLAASPLKDVAGMLRSFHYASVVARRDALPGETPEIEGEPEAWERWNRQAFLEGYLATPGIDTLLPGGEGAVSSAMAALRAWEADKAVYEIGYERSHRPEWVEIPEGAVRRLAEG